MADISKLFLRFLIETIFDYAYFGDIFIGREKEEKEKEKEKGRLLLISVVVLYTSRTPNFYISLPLTQQRVKSTTQELWDPLGPLHDVKKKRYCFRILVPWDLQWRWRLVSQYI